MILLTSIAMELPWWFMPVVFGLTYLWPLVGLTWGFTMWNPLQWKRRNVRIAAMMGIVGGFFAWWLAGSLMALYPLVVWGFILGTTFIWDWLGRQGKQEEVANE